MFSGLAPGASATVELVTKRNAECGVWMRNCNADVEPGMRPIEPMPAPQFRIPHSALRIRWLILAEHTLGRRAESTAAPSLRTVTNQPQSESFLTPGGGLTSAGVIGITIKLLRTCYTPRPSGPPRLVGLGHDCCEVQRCVRAMGWMPVLVTRHASRLMVAS